MYVWQIPNLVWTRLFRHDIWNIGIVEAPIDVFLTPGARPVVHWLADPPRGSYLADPFMIDTDAGPIILAEGFAYETRKGFIAALVGDTHDTFSAPVPVLESAVHMSYPFIVQHEGRIYCVPETGTAGAVYLYEASSFPYGWERRATLIEGFPALDPTIFQYDGLWWLFCSKMDHSHGTDLYVWYASSLYGPWSPHAMNPVKRGVSSSRPAGTPFIHCGELYRPAQDSTCSYGGAVVINRVLRLTPTEFAEECASIVGPYKDGPYRYGLHTLSACGTRTVLDGKCRRFVPYELLRILRRMVGISRRPARNGIVGVQLQRVRMFRG